VVYAVYCTASILDYAVANWIMGMDWSLVCVFVLYRSEYAPSSWLPRPRRCPNRCRCRHRRCSSVPARRDYLSAGEVTRAVDNLDAATGSLRLRAERASRPLAPARPALHRYSCCHIPGRQHLSGLAPTHHKTHQSLIAQNPFRSDVRSVACREVSYCWRTQHFQAPCDCSG